VAARKDLTTVRVEEIAEEAGYSPGSLYTYFASKEELLGAAFRSVSDQLLVLLGEPPSAGSFDAALRTLLRRLYGIAAEHRGLFLMLMAGGPRVMAAAPGERLETDMAQCRAQFLGALDRWMKEGLARGALSPARTSEHHLLAFMGIAQTFLVHWLFEGKTTALTDETDVVVDAFMDGARRREGLTGATGVRDGEEEGPA
ncbi:MAG TPA: TetR/AcrR family transcriptional regulator, partial [Myxococcota bacterium]|nr:TetR/AcrR family transcriptional regulator [Myxococcota bacterium]